MPYLIMESFSPIMNHEKIHILRNHKGQWFEHAFHTANHRAFQIKPFSKFRSVTNLPAKERSQ